MSADGSITLVWGDGERVFRLAIGQWRELQECVNRRRLLIGASTIGPMELCKALEANNAWPDDIRDVMRIGLIGGGAKPTEAHRLMTHYFDPVPPLENMRPAYIVLTASLIGVPDEVIDVKKKQETTMKPDQSASPQSTATVLQ